MSGRKAVVIAVDGLRASALGAYGNTWQPTPALDALASQSVVVEWMWRQSPELRDFYDAAWACGSLPKAIAVARGGCTLVTDDIAVAEWGEAAGFGEVMCLDSDAIESAREISETALAGLLAVAAECLPTPTESEPDATHADGASLLWIHARGFHGPWDAPLDRRAALLEAGDPEAPTFVAPPMLDATADQDALLGYQAAYAAQVSVLDECVDGLLAALADTEIEEETLVVLVGCGGFALGEHGISGADDRRLYGERLHVPCLLRPPRRREGRSAPPPRWSSLATPSDLHATLARWLSGDEAPTPPGTADLLADEPAPRPFVVARGANGEVALRTPAWMLRRVPPSATSDRSECVDGKAAPDGVELYVKPDDRWEANEVAHLCLEDVDRLLATLREATAGAEIAANADDDAEPRGR